MNILNSNNVKVCFLFDTYILYGRLLLFSEWKRLTVIGILNEFHVSQRIQIKTIVLFLYLCLTSPPPLQKLRKSENWNFNDLNFTFWFRFLVIKICTFAYHKGGEFHREKNDLALYLAIKSLVRVVHSITQE